MKFAPNAEKTLFLLVVTLLTGGIENQRRATLTSKSRPFGQSGKIDLASGRNN